MNRFNERPAKRLRFFAVDHSRPIPENNSFHPEIVFLANLGVNLRVCSCEVQVASAQALGFLRLTRNPYLFSGDRALCAIPFRADENSS